MDFRCVAIGSGGLAAQAADALLVIVVGDKLPGSFPAADAPLLALLRDAIDEGDLELKAERCLYLHRPAGLKAARLLGGPTHTAPVFEAGFDLTTAEAASWLRAVRFLRDGLAGGDPLLGNEACAQGFARTLASGLLVGHRQSMAEAAEGRLRVRSGGEAFVLGELE